MSKKPTPPAARPTKPWTVMIYMIADDPSGGALLDQQANRELDQIIHATLSANSQQLYVAVQIDFRSQPDVWRRVVGEGAWLQPESNAADPDTLYGFFDWTSRMCPADRYMLILWGHSRGPFGLFTDSPFSSPLAGLFGSPDPWTYVAQTLTLKELRTALRHARECLNQEVDVIAFKDCFMSTLETAYELEDTASYLIASPDIVPVEGWPYVRMLDQLSRLSDAKLAAKAVVRELQHHYQTAANRHGRPQVPFTLLEISKLSDVTDPLRAIATKLATEAARGSAGEPFRKALTGAAAPADPALVDVNALCRKVKRLGLKQPAERLETALAQMTSSDDSHVSLFCYPFGKRELDSSILAPHARREVYGELAIAKTGWDGIALEAMPKERPAPKPSPTHQTPGSALLQELQRQGVLEELGRKGLDVVRRVLASLAQEAGTARLGFVAEDTGKESGFMAEDFVGKESGFAARVLTGPNSRTLPGVTHAATPRKTRKR
jgi:hypothetical protein